MEPDRQVEMRPIRQPSPYSLHRRQTPEEELQEVRRRGRYQVLPPVLGPHEKVYTVDELLKDIDEEVRETLELSGQIGGTTL